MREKRGLLLRARPVLAWMGVIFALSTDHGSAEHSRPLVYTLLHRVAPELADSLSPSALDRIDWNLRKVGHVSEYALLGALVWRLVRWREGRFRYRDLWLTLTITIGYAASDEWHQSFIPSRGASPGDVFFDAFGAVAAAALSQARLLKGSIKE